MKKVKVIEILWTVVFTACLIFLSGCSEGKTPASSSGTAPGSGSRGNFESQDKKAFTLNVSSPSDLTGVVGYWVAEEQGFAKEENIKFNYVGAVQSGQLVASVVAGKIDIGGAHVNRTIAGINAGAKIKAVAANTETTREIPHMTFVALEKSNINTPKDILGRKIGIAAFGGCNEYTTYAYLLKNGINEPKGKFKISIIQSPPKLEQALRQGEIDIAGLHENPDSVLEKGGLKILFTDYDVWQTIGGATPYYFSERFIKEHPDVVRRFVRVIAKTNNWVNANPDKAREITARRGKVDIGIIRRSHFAPDAVIKEETVQVWIDLLTKFKEIKAGIKTQDIYTNEFNDLAKK